MTDKTPRPVFLERDSYRRRRLSDAAFLLPVFGLILVCAPIMWPVPQGTPTAAETGTPAMSMSMAICYVFGVWALLILGAAVLGSKTRKWDQSQPAPDLTAGAETGPDPDHSPDPR